MKAAYTKTTVLLALLHRNGIVIYLQIDRKAYGVPQSSSLGGPDDKDGKEGEKEEGDASTDQESASAVLSKLTKFIYNCQTADHSR